MAKSPAGKTPAPRKTAKTTPAARKKAAGKAVPAKAAPTKKATAKPRARPAAPKEAKPGGQAQLGLTPKQQRFVDEYLVDLNATQAAIRAGYSPETARQIAAENLAKPYIQAALAEARRLQQERTAVNADRVVLEAWNIMTADPRELVQVKVGCCRHCYGQGHKYQRTLAEFNLDRERWLDKDNDPADFDEQGGFGFNPLLEPHPQCPACHGDGHARTVLMDTRKLGPQALALYAGAKEGKYGIEIQMHDKGAAMEKLFRHLGLYEKDNQQKTDPLAALLNRIANGNNNGWRPVEHDPEAPAAGAGPTPSSVQPRQDPGDEG